MSYEYLDEKDADKNADGLKYRTHSELRSQLAQQKALLDEYKKALDVAMTVLDKQCPEEKCLCSIGLIKKEINQILGKEEGRNEDE